MKDIALRTVLTITTGKTCIESNVIETMQEFLDWFTGQSIWTHDIVRAMNFAKPHILKQLPALATIASESIDTNNFLQRISELETEFGKTVKLEALPSSLMLEMSPIESLLFANPEANYITVNVPKNEVA